MKLVPLDFGAERRELEIYAPLGRYYEVECPFCNRRNLVYYRNLTGNRGEQVKQIGNSVPVMTAAAMCECDLRGVA